MNDQVRNFSEVNVVELAEQHLGTEAHALAEAAIHQAILLDVRTAQHSAVFEVLDSHRCYDQAESAMKRAARLDAQLGELATVDTSRQAIIAQIIDLHTPESGASFCPSCGQVSPCETRALIDEQSK